MSDSNKPNGPKSAPKEGNRERYPELKPLWIGMFIDILGFYIIIPFLPTFIEVFDTTPLVIGFLLATNAVFTMVFAPIWGKISDKIGRKPVLIVSQAGTFTAFMMLAFSSNLEMLLVQHLKLIIHILFIRLIKQYKIYIMEIIWVVLTIMFCVFIGIMGMCLVRIILILMASIGIVV